MARLPFTLQTLPGSRRSRSIELSLGLSDPEGVKAWEASTRGAGGGKSINYYGQERGQISRFNRRMVLRGVNVSQENWHHIQSWRDQGESLTLSPLWSGATPGTVNTVLPLGKPAPGEDPLQDFLISDKRSAVDFERYCNRYHPDTGLEAKYHVPLYTDGWQGEQVNIGDVVNDAHFPSFEYRAYLDRDAADVGSITRVYLDPRWDADLFWVGQKVCIQTRELDTNYNEIARVDAVNSAGNYLDLSLTTVADAVLVNTTEYTYAQRTSVSNNLCPDGDMSDSGVGAWDTATGNGYDLLEKTSTQNETGTRALRCITDGAGASDGFLNILGALPEDTELVIFVRNRFISGGGSPRLWVYNQTEAANDLIEGMIGTATWEWQRHAFKVTGSAGQKQMQLRFIASHASATEFLVDRIEIYENLVAGGMETDTGVYDPDPGVATSPLSSAGTVYAVDSVTDGAAWDLSGVVVGNVVEAATGETGRITAVDDGADKITVASWDGGTPANGTIARARLAVAPGWDSDALEVNDQLTQETDHHGGTYAQGANVTAADEGIQSESAILELNNWYLVGGYFKVASGTCKVRERAQQTIISGINDAAYAFRSAVYTPLGAASKLAITSEGAAEFLVDDVMVVRLPAIAGSIGPLDDAVYDNPEPLSTDGFTIFGAFECDIDGDAFTSPDFPYFLNISRHTNTANDRIIVYLSSNDTLAFQVRENVAGAATVTLACAFNAGEKVYWAARCTGAGAMELWKKIDAGAETSNTGAGATIATGLTRTWIGRYGGNYSQQSRSSIANVMIINEAMADAEIEEVLEIMAGDTGYEQDLTLLNETYGVIYEIEPNGITPWHPADGEYIKCDIALREVGRIGAFRNAY